MTARERHREIVMLLNEDHFRGLDLCKLLLGEIIDHNSDHHYMTPPAVVDMVKERLAVQTRLAQEK